MGSLSRSLLFVILLAIGVYFLRSDHAVVGVIFVAGPSVLYFLRQYVGGGVCKSKTRLDNKVAIVTGANTGMGKETTIDFIKRGAKVIMACRSMQRAEAAAEDIIAVTKAARGQLEVMQLDLASMKSIRQFARDFKSRETRLDILMNNAGVMFPPYTETEDGFELQMGVNHLGHFLLTNLLVDMLVKSSPSRVVTVSSMGHLWSKRLKSDRILHDEESYTRIEPYCQSKLANILFSRQLARKLEGTGVSTYSVHPGAVNTELFRYIPGMGNAVVEKIVTTIFWPITKEPWQGAQTQIWCAVDESLANESGKYYSDVHEKTPSPAALRDEDALKLWEVSTKLVQLTQAETHPKLNRVCSNKHGIIRKYGLNMCRQCFRGYANDIGFKKLD